MESYLTIKDTSEGFYKEKGSKFLATAFPVTSEEGVKDHLDAVRKKYYDARHHCYAYVIGFDPIQYRANDDGEPRHSAGDPILGQIKSKNLTDTLVIVVRYFGGTKLGVSGLINAYKTAAADAISNNKVIEIVITMPIQILFPYEDTNDAMKLVSDFNIKLNSQNFTENCSIHGSIQPSQLSGFKERVKLLPQIQYKIN